MSLNRRIRELQADLAKAEKTPIADTDLRALAEFVGDAADWLGLAQDAFAFQGNRLAPHGIPFDGSDPRVLDIRKCIAALGVAKGVLREELQRVLKDRGVLPS